MSFLTPLGLLGFLTLPAIIALHMLRARKRRKVVSSLKLWTFLEPEVRGSSPMRIPLSWLLFLDLLIAALFSLALSQPRLSIPIPVHGARQFLILLDTSTSMLARDESPSRIAKAQAEIAQIISGLGERDSAALVTFGEKPRWIGDTGSNSPQEILSKLYDLSAGENGSSINEALAIGLAQMKDDLPIEIHLFSDAAFENPQLSELGASITWHLFGKKTGNQAVLNISTAVAMDGYQVFAQLANFSDEPVSRNVTLIVDGAAVDSYAYQMPANSITPQIWRQTGQASSVSVLLAGGDALKEDDRASTGIHLGSQPHIVVVAENPVLFRRVFNGFPEAYAQFLTPQDYFEQPSVDLTIFSGWLPEQLPEGVIFIVQPPQASGNQGNSPQDIPIFSASEAVPPDAAAYQSESDPLVDEINFSGVRWGKIYTADQISADFTTLLSLQLSNQTIPLLQRKQAGASRIYLLAADLTSGNLTRHPAFPIMIFKLVQSSQDSSLPAWVQVGQPIPLPDEGAFAAVSVVQPQADRIEYRPEWPSVWDATRLPGEYEFTLEDSSGLSSQYTVGVNAGSLQESDLVPGTWVEGSSGLMGEVDAGNSLDQNLDLTPWLIAAALLFLLVEAILAWR